jgi:hypothetical protein
MKRAVIATRTLAAMLVIGLTSIPTAAAVLVCQETISSGPKSGATLPDAQKAALATWVKEATDLHGPRFTAWRLAYDKALDCKPMADGTHVCEAKAQPCGVQQAPSPDLTPLPRLSPQKPPG